VLLAHVRGQLLRQADLLPPCLRAVLGRRRGVLLGDLRDRPPGLPPLPARRRLPLLGPGADERRGDQSLWRRVRRRVRLLLVDLRGR
jgi:hypothetical protein